jgi:serine/threonine protein kinase
MSPEQPNDRALSDPDLRVPAGDGQTASATVEVCCPNPACGNHSSIAADQVGRYFRCRRCRTKFKAQPGPQQPPGSQSDLGSDTAFEPWWHGPDKSANSPVADLPARLGRYEIRSRLGEGARGIVYRAYDPQLAREVVLRVLSPGLLKGQRERYLSDALAAARLRHPHLVPVLDAGQEGEEFFIASAFIEGYTLTAALDRGDLDLRQSVQIIRQAAEALAHAHGQGLIHGAVQPDNILLDAHGCAVVSGQWSGASEDRTAELDPEKRGSNPPPDRSSLAPDHWPLTTAYLAPEQASGPCGETRPSSDQYGLGVTFYELLTGQTPFAGPQAIVRYNIIHVEPPSPRSVRPELPPDLEAVCLKAMAKRPERRYPSCQELAEDLRRYLDGEPVGARQPSWRERWRRW